MCRVHAPEMLITMVENRCDHYLLLMRENTEAQRGEQLPAGGRAADGRPHRDWNPSPPSLPPSARTPLSSPPTSLCLGDKPRAPALEAGITIAILGISDKGQALRRCSGNINSLNPPISPERYVFSSLPGP